MIQKGANVLSEHAKKRLDFKPELKQINFLDRRVYQRSEGVYYPSVTSILQHMPKNKFFESWIKDVGHNADIIMRRAGDEGTQTHSLIEQDSITLPMEATLSDDYGGEETFISSKTYDTKRIKSEAFIGKTFPQCLELVSLWEDGHIISMGDGHGGLTFMEFVTNGNHHILTFSQDICETDEIIKE